ncbi:hypothetical protein B0H14DRAFT_3426523 [Mycena olivaceomarginata]|nr:hypothetical protein B0H14DRAFT_3426523 [Mycena olivaceomarginata]
MHAEGTILYTIYRDACGLAPGLFISLPSPYAQPTASAELAESTEEPSYGSTPFKLRLARACVPLFGNGSSGAAVAPASASSVPSSSGDISLVRFRYIGMARNGRFATLIHGRPPLHARACFI